MSMGQECKYSVATFVTETSYESEINPWDIVQHAILLLPVVKTVPLLKKFMWRERINYSKWMGNGLYLHLTCV